MSSLAMYNVCAVCTLHVRSLFVVYLLFFAVYKRSVYIRRPLYYYYARQPSSPYRNKNNMRTTRQYDILGISGHRSYIILHTYRLYYMAIILY